MKALSIESLDICPWAARAPKHFDVNEDTSSGARLKFALHFPHAPKVCGVNRRYGSLRVVTKRIERYFHLLPL
jgi:hypothetical protein